MASTQQSKQQFTFALGRRKEAVARVRLYKGKGEHMVNGKPLSVYFPGNLAASLFQRPLVITKTQGSYWVSAKVVGGGKRSQLTAVILGLARALALLDSGQLRSLLKKEKLLTRDPRVRERRKIGTGGRARRKKQSPKR